jgi:hypothetical protein
VRACGAAGFAGETGCLVANLAALVATGESERVCYRSAIRPRPAVPNQEHRASVDPVRGRSWPFLSCMVVCLCLLLPRDGDSAPTGHRVIARCVHFEEVRIPADFLIGKPGDGLTNRLTHVLAGSRLRFS